MFCTKIGSTRYMVNAQGHIALVQCGEDASEAEVFSARQMWEFAEFAKERHPIFSRRLKLVCQISEWIKHERLGGCNDFRFAFGNIWLGLDLLSPNDPELGETAMEFYSTIKAHTAESEAFFDWALSNPATPLGLRLMAVSHIGAKNRTDKVVLMFRVLKDNRTPPELLVAIMMAFTSLGVEAELSIEVELNQFSTHPNKAVSRVARERIESFERMGVARV